MPSKQEMQEITRRIRKAVSICHDFEAMATAAGTTETSLHLYATGERHCRPWMLEGIESEARRQQLIRRIEDKRSREAKRK